MSGDAHVQFWEGLGVRFPGATLPLPTVSMSSLASYCESMRV